MIRPKGTIIESKQNKKAFSSIKQEEKKFNAQEMKEGEREKEEKKTFIGDIQDLCLTYAPNKNNEKILMILKQDKHWRLYDALCATQSPRHI